MHCSGIELIKLIFPIASLQGIFLSILLFFNRKGNPQANKILALLLISISLIVIEYFFSIYSIFESFPHLIKFSSPFWFAIGPLTLLYVIKLVHSDKILTVKHLLHFLPMLVSIIILSKFYVLPAEYKIEFYKSTSASKEFQLINFVWNYSNAIQIMLYTFLGYRYLKQYEQNYINQYSGKHYPHIKWLNIIFTVFISYIIIDFILPHVFIFFNKPDIMPFYEGLSIFCLSSISYIIGYFAINQPESMFPALNENGLGLINVGKYQTSKLNKDIISDHVARLNNAMKEKKLYLNSELKLKDLAAELEIPNHHLSQVINQELKINFYDYVNSFRVKEAQVCLKNPDYKNHTVLSIALEVGFGNSASFYRAFKKFTGTIPSHYIKSVKTSEEKKA